MSSSSFDTAMISRVGDRTTNQDRCNFLERNGVGCWSVADGLGGQGGGEKAAGLALDTLLHEFQRQPDFSADNLLNMLKAANRAVWSARSEDPELGRMATTIVVLLCDGRQAMWAHAGDSRLYLFRAGKFLLHTCDHSVPQALVEAGEISASDIRDHPDRGSLRRSLGQQNEIRVSLEKPRPVGEGDAFLLCSDGFWEEVHEIEMELELAKADSAADWLRGMEARVIPRQGKQLDNYSAVAVFPQPTKTGRNGS